MTASGWTQASNAPAGANEALAELASAARDRFGTSEDVAAEFIRDAIVRGVFPPGDRLNQEQIAAALGMSRIPIRASLRQLEGERLLTLHRFRGATVATRSVEEITEIYELRSAVECIALAHVAANLTTEAVLRLTEMAGLLDAASMEPEEWTGVQRQFYCDLFDVARRPRMSELAGQLRAEVSGYVSLYGLRRPHGGHAELVAMLAAGDVNEAQQRHRRHLEGVRDRLIAARRRDIGANGL